jgi:hypothetical protein
MSNTFTALIAPAGDGVGAAVNTSALGAGKFVFVGGLLATDPQKVIIEAANANAPLNSDFSPVATIDQSNNFASLWVVAQWMRVRVTGFILGTSTQATVGISATNVTAGTFVGLNVPVLQDGVGAATDTSGVPGAGNTRSFFVGGILNTDQQIILIEGANAAIPTESDFAPIASIQKPNNHVTVQNAARWVRVRIVNFLPGISTQAVVSMGASTDLVLSDLARLSISQQFQGNQYSLPVALVDAAVVVNNCSASNILTLLATAGIGATRELDNPTGLVVGMTWQVWFSQDAIGGRALTFDTWYDWGDEGAPDYTTQGANITNIITCVAMGANQVAATSLPGFA